MVAIAEDAPQNYDAVQTFGCEFNINGFNLSRPREGRPLATDHSEK